MEDHDAIERALDAMADLLKLADEVTKDPNKKKKLPKDIYKQLDELEVRIRMYQKLTEKTIEKPGIEEARIKKIIIKPPEDLPIKERRLIERASKLKADVMERKRVVGSIAKKKKKASKISKSKARKKKFRGVGGSKKWRKI